MISPNNLFSNSTTKPALTEAISALETIVTSARRQFDSNDSYKNLTKAKTTLKMHKSFNVENLSTVLTPDVASAFVQCEVAALSYSDYLDVLSQVSHSVDKSLVARGSKSLLTAVDSSPSSVKVRFVVVASITDSKLPGLSVCYLCSLQTAFNIYPETLKDDPEKAKEEIVATKKLLVNFYQALGEQHLPKLVMQVTCQGQFCEITSSVVIESYTLGLYDGFSQFQLLPSQPFLAAATKFLRSKSGRARQPVVDSKYLPLLKRADFGIIGTKLHAILRNGAKFDGVYKHSFDLCIICRDGLLALSDEATDKLYSIELYIGDSRYSDGIEFPVDEDFIEEIRKDRDKYVTNDLKQQTKVLVDALSSLDSNSELVAVAKIAIALDPRALESIVFECSYSILDILSVARSKSIRFTSDVDGVISADIRRFHNFKLSEMIPPTSSSQTRQSDLWENNAPFGLYIIFGESGSGKSTIAEIIERSLQINKRATIAVNFDEPGISWHSWSGIFLNLSTALQGDTDVLIIDSLRTAGLDAGGAFLAGGLNAGIFKIFSWLDALAHTYQKSIIIVFNPLSARTEVDASYYMKIFEGSASLLLNTKASKRDYLEADIKSRFIGARLSFDTQISKSCLY